MKKILFERNITSMILAREVAEFCDEELAGKFFDFCLSTFNPQELKEMILITYYDNQNILGRSLCNEIGTVVIIVWNFYLQILNEAELEDLIFKNNQGRIYFRKVFRKKQEAVEKFKAIVIDRYGEDRTRKLIRF